MQVIDHLDLVTKRIYLAVGVRAYHPVDDIYKAVRQLRRTNEALRGFDMPVVASGNIPKGGGKFTPRLATFRLGWKIVPEDTSHVLYVSGEQITDEGESGPACFDLEPLSASSKVIIQYEPPLAEVIVPELAEIPEGIALEESVQAVKAKTDILPTESQLWNHDDRRLTSRDIESDAQGEHLPSEEQVQNIEVVLAALITELVKSMPPSAPKAHFQV